MELHTRLGLRPVINVSGTMTSLGASIAVSSVAVAMTEILPQFVEMGDLQRRASTLIARACGAEAGFVTASCSAGLTLAVAASITGNDFAAMERLPDVRGLRREVVIQTGHLVNYGAPVDQAIRLAGASLVPVGQATEAFDYQLDGAITDHTAAAVYVVSHHTVLFGLIPFETFVEVAHARGVPVIVDAASEYDMTSYIGRGADIVLYSAHKFLGGPTAGLVAGRLALVSAAYQQNYGIGRGMKVGKESVFGAMAALESWATRDHAAIRARERSALVLWQHGLTSLPGVHVTISPDPTGNPLDRLRIDIDAAAAGITPWDLVDALAAHDPPIIARDHEAEIGYFFLDPCNLHPGDAPAVLVALTGILKRAQTAPQPATTLAQRYAKRLEARRRWPN